MTRFAVFLSAFLLFEVQPILARSILPWYGGSPAVWTTCMLFFQTMLLVGYSYAHWLSRRRSVRIQVAVHLALLGVAIACLPITLGEPGVGALQHSVASIGWVLLITVGLPYSAIAATMPLYQSWSSRLSPEASTYRLYAVSNGGALLGLLAYPLAVEPLLRLRTQALAWSWGFVLFTAASAACAVAVLRRSVPAPAPAAPTTRRAAGGASEQRRGLWLALSACGSVVLLAGTNQICQEVAVVPFLWVLPLALYLVTFVLCFGRKSRYSRRILAPLLWAGLGAVTVLTSRPAATAVPLLAQVAIHGSLVFVCCMVCHGELARAKPSAESLTAFYLFVALGGAAGSLFVCLLAPLLFDGYWEYPASVVVSLGLLGLCLLNDGGGTPTRRGRRVGAVAWAAGLLVLGSLVVVRIRERDEGTIAATRNFFGTARVLEEELEGRAHLRWLEHWGVMHGQQLLAPEQRRLPTSYYGPSSGAGLALRFHPRRRAGSSPVGGLRIGSVGLGIGTIAAYAEPGDHLRFYEINPEVERIAREYFTYLRDAPCEVDVVLGDARLSLAREQSRGDEARYDVLVLDAFTGASVPVHLLTYEAFSLYCGRLDPDGILAVNVSNRHLDLGALVRGLARELGKEAVLIVDESEQMGTCSSTWVLVTSSRTFLEARQVSWRFQPWPATSRSDTRWTDDYSNLLGVLASPLRAN